MARQCILIVEDDLILRQLLETLLEKEGYEALVARDGYEALVKMETHPPDAIIADIMMPRMDGYDFYAAVRERVEWISIPFIFLTAKDDHEDIMHGKALGAEDYITKPFASNDLLVILRARLQRAADIQQVVQAEALHLKEQIVNVLSHELRTPLTYISGYTDLALTDASDLPDMQFREFLSGIKRGSDRLMKLVSDLLLVFEIEAGVTALGFNEVYKRCDELRSVVGTVVLMYRPQARFKAVTLDMELPGHLPPVHLNLPYFTDALGRLISNGIKFTFGKDARVIVSAKEAGKWIDITVADNGVGIALEHMDSLFEAFQQLNRERMEQQGLGIGLYIAQQLIKLHGGDILVSSELGRGSAFTIRLPRIEAS